MKSNAWADYKLTFEKMKRVLPFILFTTLLLSLGISVRAQEEKKISGYLVRMCVYEGDTIPCINLPPVYIFKPLKFKNKREQIAYTKLVRDVKKVYPLSLEVRQAVIETYEFLQTLPDKKSKERHIKNVERSVKEQYTPQMKRLTFAQGKLLIKLIDRQSNQTGYELIRAFMGPFKAGFYQAFAKLFGASLKKEYDPEGEDRLIERIVLQIESGQL